MYLPHVDTNARSLTFTYISSCTFYMSLSLRPRDLPLTLVTVSKPHDAHALTQGTALGLALFGTVVFFSFLFIQVSMAEAFPYALENFHVRDYESS